MSNWAPKPLRPTLNEGLFKFDHPEVVIKSESAIEKQRRFDGTPITTGNKTIFEPYQPKLTLRDADMKTDRIHKGSKKSTAPEADAGSPVDTEADPEERIRKAREVVKAIMSERGFKDPIG